MKCIPCLKAPLEHLFKICGFAKCQCSCVTQIYNMPINQIEKDMSLDHPSFLLIDEQEMRTLPKHIPIYKTRSSPNKKYLNSGHKFGFKSGKMANNSGTKEE